MPRHQRSFPRATLPVMALALGLSSCDIISPPDPDLPVAARIWSINGTSDQVRMRVDGEALGGAIPAGSLSTRLLLGEGASTVRMEPATGSSLTGGVTVQLPADGTGGGQYSSYILTTETAGGAVQARLMNDTLDVPTVGKGKLRVVHAAAENQAVDIWYRNPSAPTFTRFSTPMDYGEISEFIESDPGVWRILVTPRTTPTPGENPEGSILAEQTLLMNLSSVQTLLVFSTATGGVRLELRPRQ